MLLVQGFSGVLMGSAEIGLGYLGCPWLKVLASILKNRGGPLLDFRGSMQLLDSSHVRDRDKALLRAILSSGVWNGFLLGGVRGENVPCRFCWGPDGDGHLFWECSYPSGCYPRES